jgi:large subunit ribosomal protein L25
MKDLLVEVTPRETFGKNESRRMRRAGQIPAILYGADKGPVPLTVDPTRSSASASPGPRSSAS